MASAMEAMDETTRTLWSPTGISRLTAGIPWFTAGTAKTSLVSTALNRFIPRIAGRVLFRQSFPYLSFDTKIACAKIGYASIVFSFCGHTTREVSNLKYRDLSELLEKEPQAQEYFNMLSENERQRILDRSKSIDAYDRFRYFITNN
ncbi:MAG: hypothetical protein LKK00_09760 [Intestinimonas sp.]|jgi:hypothetical protein|nr:hypothetical protein [Intestinimonas sp.]